MKTLLRKTRPLSFKLLFCWCRKTYFCRHTAFGRDETDSNSIFIFVCCFFVSWISVIVIAHCCDDDRRILFDTSNRVNTLIHLKCIPKSCEKLYTCDDAFRSMDDQVLINLVACCWNNRHDLFFERIVIYFKYICFHFICIYWTRAIVFTDSPYQREKLPVEPTMTEHEACEHRCDNGQCLPLCKMYRIPFGLEKNDDICKWKKFAQFVCSNGKWSSGSVVHWERAMKCDTKLTAHFYSAPRTHESVGKSLYRSSSNSLRQFIFE